MPAKWVHNDLGGGSTLRLAKGLVLCVGLGVSRGDKWYWSFNGIRSANKQFESAEEAMESVQRVARKVLQEAITNLDSLMALKPETEAPNTPAE